MTHSELVAMLSGGAGAEPLAAAAADAPAAAAPAGAASAPADAPAPSSAAPAAAFSADSIASILSGIPAAASTAAPAFSADSIANILSGIQPPQQQVAPLSLNAVLAPEATVPLVDGPMERRLAEFLPGGNAQALESVRETLTTPQMAQARSRLLSPPTLCPPLRPPHPRLLAGGARRRPAPRASILLTHCYCVRVCSKPPFRLLPA